MNEPDAERIAALRELAAWQDELKVMTAKEKHEKRHRKVPRRYKRGMGANGIYAGGVNGPVRPPQPPQPPPGPPLVEDAQDIDLMHPDRQEELRELIASQRADAQAENHVEDLPYHSPLARRKRETQALQNLHREPSASIQVSPDGSELQALAVAVIKNAVNDLSITSHRAEARKFLLEELWDNCIWLEILGENMLTRRFVEREVQERLRTGRRGHRSQAELRQRRGVLVG